MKTKLIVKQLIISLLIGFLPYFVLNVLFSSVLTQTSIKERELTTWQHLQSVSQSLEGLILNYEEMSQWIIGNEIIRSYLLIPDQASATDYNDAYNNAIRELFLLPFSARSYAGMIVARNDGRMLTSGSLRALKLSQWERQTAKEKNGGWFWSTENDVLSICRLIRDKYQLSSHLGYIKLSLDPQQMLDAFSGIETGAAENFALTTPEGDILFSNFPQDIQNALVTHVKHILDYPPNKELTVNGENHTSYALMHYEIPDKQLSVICVRALDSQPYISYRNTFLMISILVTAIILSLQIFLTNRWLIKPLYKLTKLMQAIEVEDYSVRFHVRGNDEISVVGRQFNHMCERLQSLFKEVYQSNLKTKEAEILALQAEINPHFMFNTLDIIYWMVNIGKSGEAMKMIRALSESFRITLYRTKDGFVTLAMALNQVRNYLYIQKMRLQDNLQYTIEIDDGIDPEKVQVLHLVLQPLVENAIQHGIRADGAGEIIITICVQDHALVYQIYDTGSQADEKRILQALHEPTQGSHGLALYNVNARIHLKFGEAYGITFLRPEDRGTLFIVRQPLILKGASKEE